MDTYVAVHAYPPIAIRRAIAAGAQCIEHGHLIDEATAKLMADNNIWLSTQPFLSMEDTGPLTGPSADRAQQLFAGTPKIYGFVRKHGIKTAWGSDVLFSPAIGPRQNVILTHLANWYKNAEVLQMATSGNAELLSLSNLRNPYPGKLGVIEEGALADLLVVDGNPLDDIRLMEDPHKNFVVIMKDGRPHKNVL